MFFAGQKEKIAEPPAGKEGGDGAMKARVQWYLFSAA